MFPLKRVEVYFASAAPGFAGCERNDGMVVGSEFSVGVSGKSSTNFHGNGLKADANS